MFAERCVPGVLNSCLMKLKDEQKELLIISLCCVIFIASVSHFLVTSPPPSARNSVDTQSTRVMLDGEEFEVEFDETTDNVVG